MSSQWCFSSSAHRPGRALSYSCDPQRAASGNRSTFFIIAKHPPELLHLLTFTSCKSLTTSYTSSTPLPYSHLPTSTLILTSDHYFGSWLTDIVLTSKSGMTFGYFCVHVGESSNDLPHLPLDLFDSSDIQLQSTYLPNHLRTLAYSYTSSFDRYIFM